MPTKKPSKKPPKESLKEEKITQDFVLPERPYKKIAVTFIVLTLLLLIVIVYFSLSRAVITIKPTEVAATKEFTLQVPVNQESENPSILSASHSKEELEIVQSFEVEKFQTQPGKTSGTITVFNDNSKAQTLIATTRFLTPEGLLFRLKKQITIPVKGKIVAEVAADQAGAKYDIAPTKFTIPGLSNDLQKLVYGVSDQAFTGGIKRIGTITTEDLTRAATTASQSIEQKILQQLGLKQSENQLIFIDHQVISEDFSGKEGDEVDKFTITQKIDAQIVTLDRTKLLDWTKQQYKKTLGQSEEIINYSLDSFTSQLLKTNSNKAEIKTSISAFVLGNLDVNNFNKKKLYGMDEGGVKVYFKQYEKVKDVEVKFSPFWVKTVPSLTDHVELKIQQ